MDSEMLFTTHEGLTDAQLQELNALLVKANKRIVKAGLEPLTLTIVNTEYVETLVEGQRVLSYTVRLDGSMPKLGGWEFVAKIEHVGGGNIIGKSPFFNEPIPEKYYTIGSICDHCKVNRERSVTYLIYNKETLEWMQVGSSCVGDFSASMKGPAALEQVWSWLCVLYDWFSQDEDDEQVERWISLWNVRTILKWANRLILTQGYVSRKKADEEMVPSTTDVLWYILNPKTEQDREFAKSLKVPMNEDDLIQQQIDWVISLEQKESRSEYENNLIVLVESENIRSKHVGYVVSIPAAYDRWLNGEREKANRPESKHVSEVGQRITMELTLQRMNTIDTLWGYMTIMSFVDDEGNDIVWKSGSIDTSKYEKGSKYQVTGTVKKHSEFRGRKQTEISRCKIA